MFLSFTTVVTLALFAGAFSAPVTPKVGIAWSNIKEGSLRLNELAKILLIQELSHLKTVESVVKGKRVLVEPGDKCDPANLKADSKPCFKKMVSALNNYKDVFGTISQFKNTCTKVGERVNKVVKELLFQMVGTSSEEKRSIVHNWEELGLCQDSIEKLFSFSIIMARVFALGDPAKHSI